MTDPLTYLPLNPREFLVLFVLVDHPRYGYDIVRSVEGQTDGEVRLDPANLYRILKRLMRDGLVKATSVRPTGRDEHHRRRFYEVTETGRAVVAAEAARLDRLMAAAKAKDLIPRRHRSS